MQRRLGGYGPKDLGELPGTRSIREPIPQPARIQDLVRLPPERRIDLGRHAPIPLLHVHAGEQLVRLDHVIVETDQSLPGTVLGEREDKLAVTVGWPVARGDEPPESVVRRLLLPGPGR